MPQLDNTRGKSHCIQQGKPRLRLADIILWGDSWLAVRSSESWFCFVWTGLCLAGGFNPLYPTGTVQQRHLYSFLSIKPVVTFFFSTEFSPMSVPKQGAQADHVEQLCTMAFLNAISVTIKLHSGFKTERIVLIFYIDSKMNCFALTTNEESTAMIATSAY